MRIAVVAPLMARVLGNRHALSIARELGRQHEVVFVAHTVSQEIIPDVRRILEGTEFRWLHARADFRLSRSAFALAQLRRGLDRALSVHLFGMHKEKPLDAIVVFANEGHWLGEYVASWPSVSKPTTCVCVLDPIDNSFLLVHERDQAPVRYLAAFLLPFVRRIELRRLTSFDVVVVNSRWTEGVVRFLYGVSPEGVLPAVDLKTFHPVPSLGESPFILAPTASATDGQLQLIAWVNSNGVPVRTVGPRRVPGVPDYGFVADSELAKLYSVSAGTLFLFEYEALGMIPLESLACGTPVVTLPRQGPYRELEGNPNVYFARTSRELVSLCEALLGAGRDPLRSAACQSSVQSYSPELRAAELSRLLNLERAPGGEENFDDQTHTGVNARRCLRRSGG